MYVFSYECLEFWMVHVEKIIPGIKYFWVIQSVLYSGPTQPTFSAIMALFKNQTSNMTQSDLFQMYYLYNGVGWCHSKVNLLDG